MAKLLKQTYGFAKEVMDNFSKDRGSLFAAAIAFYGLISIIPLLLLGIAVLGYILGSESARHQVITFVRNFIPVGREELERNLVLLSKQSSILGGIGILALLWTGSQVFVILQHAINTALGSTKRIGFLRARATALAMVIIIGILFILSVGMSSLADIIRGFDIKLLGKELVDFQLAWNVFFGILVPFVISVIAFTLIYKYLPLADVDLRGPILGGLTAGILFEIAKYGFQWYVTNIANFNAVYGTLGGVVILVLWIYYTSLIGVLGAEVASVYIERTKQKEG
ncbi:MAG: YihY/virulence factor BrkB family protein [Armatimonadota bacterium]|nr:YihY/virulence factor BrkB family protein [Armatimonadota bacterium]